MTPSNKRTISALDVEYFLLSILPSTVPPEFVADAFPLFYQLHISPHDAVSHMLKILCDGLKAMPDLSGQWRNVLSSFDYMQLFREAQGWQPLEYWDQDRANHREFIDQTIERYCSTDASES